MQNMLYLFYKKYRSLNQKHKKNSEESINVSVNYSKRWELCKYTGGSIRSKLLINEKLASFLDEP